jgi:hypothetical protein
MVSARPDGLMRPLFAKADGPMVARSANRDCAIRIHLSRKKRAMYKPQAQARIEYRPDSTRQGPLVLGVGKISEREEKRVENSPPRVTLQDLEFENLIHDLGTQQEDAKIFLPFSARLACSAVGPAAPGCANYELKGPFPSQGSPIRRREAQKTLLS